MFIMNVSEKRCEITLFILFDQIFEQKFTKLFVFLSFCQLGLSLYILLLLQSYKVSCI